MPSDFIQTDRLEKKEILSLYNKIKNIPYYDNIVDAIPQAIFILTEGRQIVYVNNYFLEISGYANMEEFLGGRPGEVFNCIHSKENSEGCGGSEDCRWCGAINTVLKSQNSGKSEDGECNLMIKPSEKFMAMNFSVRSTPVEIEGIDYYIVVMQDISFLKRKEILERVFLHDIGNSIGSINGMIELMKFHQNDPEISKNIKMLDFFSDNLIHEIEYHRILMSAETNTLILKDEKIDLCNFIDEVKKWILSNPISNGVEVVNYCSNISIVSDKLLLRRILLNLLKNAVEASDKDDKIFINTVEDDKNIIISVKNKAVISDEVKGQIFQRSFSTKSPSRGLGTYSVKLFTENYLGGKVIFRSEEGFGTEFVLTFPKELYS